MSTHSTALLRPEHRDPPSFTGVRVPYSLQVLTFVVLCGGCPAPQKTAAKTRPEPEPTRSLSSPRDTADWLTAGRRELGSSSDSRFLLAASSFQRAIDLEPTNSEAWYLFAFSCEQELTVFPGRPRAQGQSEALREKAKRGYRNALRHGCSGEQAVWALESLTDAALSSKSPRRALLELGALLERSRRYQAARDVYARALSRLKGTAVRRPFLAGERRMRARLAEDLARVARTSKSKSPGARLRLLNRAYRMADGAQAAGLRQDYYRAAADHFVSRLASRLPPAARIAFLPVLTPAQRQTEAGKLLSGYLVSVLAQRGFPVEQGRGLSNRLAGLGVDLRDPGQRDLLRLGREGKFAALLSGGAGQVLQIRARSLTGAGTLVSETYQRLQDRELEQVPPPRRPPLSLAFRVLAEREGPRGKEELWAGEGAVFRAGDRFQIHVKADHQAFVYLILHDSSGTYTRLFPRTDLLFPNVPLSAATQNPIPANTLRKIPPGRDGFIFDERPGRETLYLLASRSQLRRLDQLLEELNQRGSRGRRLRDHLSELEAGSRLGIDRSKGLNSDAASNQGVYERARSWGAVIRRLSFLHR